MHWSYGGKVKEKERKEKNERCLKNVDRCCIREYDERVNYIGKVLQGRV